MHAQKLISGESVVARPCLTAALLLLAGQSASAVVSNNATTAGTNFDGIYINQFVGATSLYALGYTGTRSVVANIEAGHIWGTATGHQTLTHVTTFLNAAPSGQLGQTDRHATWCGQAIGGRKLVTDAPGSLGEAVRQGIAPGADLWSGAIATSWTPPAYSLSFGMTSTSFRNPYDRAMVTGVAGRTADVINSSWGASVPTGFNYEGAYTDYLANISGKTVCFSAGNSGPGANTVGSPGSAWNNITVGALGADTDPNPYNTVSSFSSRGPSSYFDPVSGATIPGVRATVDISAPGQNLDLAFYGGATGGNTGGSASGAVNSYSTELAGTSFASPIVAGGAALLVDVAYDLYAANPNARDGRVIKAILLNSATKTAGWSNGQSLVSGVITTTQSLDWNVGAGRLNLAAAYTNQTAGTTDMPGLTGGSVLPVGWDYGEVFQNAPTDYLISSPLAGGSMFTATLDWFMDNSYVSATDTVFVDSLDNLDLEFWNVVGGVPTTLVAESKSTYNNVEHLTFAVPATGDYMIRVKWTSELFDFVGDANAERFGLAWTGVAVPAPGALGLLALSGMIAARRRRTV